MEYAIFITIFFDYGMLTVHSLPRLVPFLRVLDNFESQHQQLAVPKHLPDPGSVSLPVDGHHPHRPAPHLSLLHSHRLVRPEVAHRLHGTEPLLLGPACQLHPVIAAHPAQLPLECHPVLEWWPAGGCVHNRHLAKLR